jgi:hypothetical protein
VVASLPRLLLAFLLPNPDGDAYAYLNTIHAWRESLVAGTFTIKTLRDFWLPLYQFLCALISTAINHPVYVSKLVSAASGIGICALVFLITWHLTANRLVSLVAALLVSLSPLHILFSAFSMTEIPHALFVMGCLYAALTRRWMLAAVCAALAGFTRVESWMLIALLPTFEFFVRGRIPWRTCVVLGIAPLLWLYICWAATGDFLFYFHERSIYIRDHYTVISGYRNLSSDRLWWNGQRLLHSVNPVVLLGCFVGAGMRSALKGRLDVVAVAACFFGYLGFLVAAFLSGNQPEIWDRYGLLSFVIGVPLAAWTYQQLTRGRPRFAVVLAAVSLAVCATEAQGQIEDARGTIKQTSAKQIIANSLYRHFQEDASIRILSDDPELPSMAHIPPDHFTASAVLPAEPAAILAEMVSLKIDYIVYQKSDAHSALDNFPQLRRGIPIEPFELDFPRFTTDSDESAYLYKLK